MTRTEPHEMPSGAARLGVAERSRHTAHAAQDEGVVLLQRRSTKTPASSQASAGFLLRARVGRHGRVWVDRVLAGPGTELGQRRRAGQSDVAARDALRGAEEAEEAVAGSADGVVLAALRAAGHRPVETGQLAAAAWHHSTRTRRGADGEESRGLRAGLEAPDPGMALASSAVAAGPAAVAEALSGPRGGGGAGGVLGGASSAAASWQVRTRLLADGDAVHVGGGSSALVGAVPGAVGPWELVSGAAALAGSKAGASNLARLLGSRTTPPSSTMLSSSSSSSSRMVGVPSGGSAAALPRSADMRAAAAPLGTDEMAAEAAAAGWPWLQQLLAEAGGASHLAAAPWSSHTGLLAQRLGLPSPLQRSRVPRVRRLDQCYFAPDNALSMLVEAADASQAEATHRGGVACPGGVGAQANVPTVLLRGHARVLPTPAPSLSTDADQPSTTERAQLHMTNQDAGRGDAEEEAFWAAAARAPRPITVMETTALLTKAANDTA